jgi:hypothetical protein
MNRDIILIAAVAVGAVVVLNRAAAQVAPGGTKSPPINNTSINNQLWGALLGGAWKGLVDGKNSDGSPAFLVKNFLGQVTTSDGKPVGQQWQDLFPSTYGGMQDVDLGGASDGVDWLDKLGW